MSIYGERDWITDLATAWEDAERGAIRAGDTVIQNHRTAPDEYTVYVAEQPNRDSGEYVRILKRAPKPKPEPKPRVVMASWVLVPDQREAYTLQGAEGWESRMYAVEAGDLVDPVEMVELPDRQALNDAILGVFHRDGGYSWPGATPLVDAVLELLKGEA